MSVLPDDVLTATRIAVPAPPEISLAHPQTELQRRATDQVGHLDALAGELIQARKMDALGHLASGITHDFRNVLQTIISGLDLIEARAHDPEHVRRLAASLMRVAEHGVGLTQRLLAFARRQELTLAVVDLVQVMGSVAEVLARTLGTKIHVAVEPPSADLWRAFTDAGQLELALLNLGINARDAMAHGGTLRLRARNATIPQFDRRRPAPPSMQSSPRVERRGPPLVLGYGDYVLVTVSDTGSGMDAETLARAAEPFFTTKPADQGTGLGLSMVHGFATQHGGALRLSSRPGHGTSVEIWLPRVTEAQPAPGN